MKRTLFLIAIVVLSFFVCTKVLHADCDLSCLNGEIDQYTQKISQLQGQANTLSNQIESYNAQIKLEELKVQQTQDEITLLGGRIDQVEISLQALTKAFSARASATYKMAMTGEPVYLLLSSSDLTDALLKYHYLQQIESYDQNLMTRLKSVQNTYIVDKQQSEALQQQLQIAEASLNSQKQAKAQLLADTQGSELSYQKLLSQAEAQLAAFSTFAQNQGGASLLSNQTDCGDSWGCYYNQRDSGWGALPLNNTQYTIASDGCLVTSMAMIYTYFGHKDVTPISINSNSSNFASYYPAYLNYPISASGTGVTRNDIWNRNNSSSVTSAIDSQTGSNKPVVIGINAYGGTHFVVIKSGSNGNYSMNDPFIPNGKNLNFTDHYSISSIFEVDSVSIN